jgi:methyltransferase (TIGR00027 family)
MPKGPVSTCEGAAARRAYHALYERPPVFDDSWAIKMVGARTRWSLRIPAIYRRRARERVRSGRDNIVAFALGSFRLTDAVVEEAGAEGVSQYLILSAGLDSFALRRSDLPVRVYELDHPAAQAMKRSRVLRAAGSWPPNLELVPIDFEVTSIGEALKASTFEPSEPAVASWLNSIPYLTREATAASLGGLSQVLAPSSRLVFNYPPQVQLNPAQEKALSSLRASVDRIGEPFRATYLPEDMSTLVESLGFVIELHLTEDDMRDRYFQHRTSGPMPTLPGRLIVARRAEAS